MFRMRSLAILLAACGVAAGETVLLKDGTFFEGKIAVQTSRSIRLDTRFGARTFQRNEIEEIIPTGSAVEPTADFASLSAAAKAILNAQADYQLGEYEKALGRIEPLKEFDGDEGLRIQRDWLIIEINERLGRWDTAKRLLKEKAEKGAPPERIRVRAHLDVFESNPEYDLRFIGEKHARNFIQAEELRNQAREAGSLRAAKVMRAALEEYCEQLLVEDKLSVKAFAEKLDLEATYKTVVESWNRGDIGEALPYMQDLRAAEASLTKAQSILGDYGVAFEFDLSRTEMYHLVLVVFRLAEEAFANSPENFTPASDPRSGQLTGEGRRQWQERCDEFLKRAQPLFAVLEYMRTRVDLFPSGLRDLSDFLDDLRERLDETIKAVKKAKGRTHV